jgi:hypothetical protein
MTIVAKTARELISENKGKGLWSETLAACQECLKVNRQFFSDLERHISEPDQDPMEPVLWEHFIEARKDLFDFTTVNLNILAKNLSKNRDSEAESQIREDLLTSLEEVVALEEKLTAYLSENLGLLKETINDLSKSQALFAGYASMDTKPSAIVLDSRA